MFVQHTWDIAEKIKLECGLRADLIHYSNHNFSNTELFVLPRISVLYTFNSFWSSSIGKGLGYKTPTIYTEQTESFQYQNVLPLNNISSERSYDTTADINFKTNLGKEVLFSANQMFFYTTINNATVLQQDNFGNSFFSNSGKSVSSIGFETNA